MMDPLAALSVAAAVIQFVDFGLTLASDGVELYESGSLAKNDELELVTKDLTRLTDDIVAVPTHALNYSEDEASLKKLAIACQGIGEELLAQLESLRVQPSGSQFKHGLESFRKSLRGAIKKGKIQSIEGRLKRVQDQVKMNILNLLSNRSSRVQSLLNDLLDESRRHCIDHQNKLDKIRKEILQAIDKADSSRGASIREVFANIRTYCLELAKEGEKLDKSQRVLRSLKCTNLRESAIKEAYAKTFEWIFSEPDVEREERPNFLQWLRQGDGIYWISGKAGSGKSTLMKLLCNSEHTETALKVWAGDEKLVTASFFFWNAGSMVEKSHQGLLQSILYQILKQCPELIPTICSSRWHFNATDHELDGIWNRKELDGSFHRLKDQLLSSKLCFVVDGLDEYDGDEREIIKTLQNLALSSSIKICASSRPWNAFEKAFGHNLDQKLCLQDFTKNDIRLYATGKLKEDASFSMKKSMDSRYNQLIEDIVERSSGVFLWVYLVVRSLLRGLTDENDSAFLRKRLDHFPSDLKDYFLHMLKSSDDFYRKMAARIFLVMLNRNFSRNSALTVLSFHYLEKAQDNPNYALDRNLKRISNEEGFKISEQLKPILNACCKDLVEVKRSLEHKGFAFMEYQVEFLHRTVKDFFLDEEILPILKASSGSGFDPKVALCNVLLAQFKGLPNSAFFFPKTAKITGWVENMPNEMMILARDVEIYNKRPEIALLDELEFTLLARSQLPKSQLSEDDSEGPPRSPHSDDFLATVTRSGLCLYLAAKLDSEPQRLYRLNQIPSLLAIAVDQNSPVDPDMARVLLTRGANPNTTTPFTSRHPHETSASTIWSEYLGICYQACKDEKFTHSALKERAIFETMKAFICHGADTEVKLFIRHKVNRKRIRPVYREEIKGNFREESSEQSDEESSGEENGGENGEQSDERSGGESGEQSSEESSVEWNLESSIEELNTQHARHSLICGLSRVVWAESICHNFMRGEFEDKKGNKGEYSEKNSLGFICAEADYGEDSGEKTDVQAEPVGLLNLLGDILSPYHCEEIAELIRSGLER